MTIEHEAAKPKKPRDIEFADAPQQESIRGMSPRTIRRNPSSDQKRVRRAMQRKKTASEDDALTRMLVTAAREDQVFEVEAARGDGVGNTSACASCGGTRFNDGGYCNKCGRHKTAAKTASEDEPTPKITKAYVHYGFPHVDVEPTRVPDRHKPEVEHEVNGYWLNGPGWPQAKGQKIKKNGEPYGGFDSLNVKIPSHIKDALHELDQKPEANYGRKESSKTATQFDTTADRLNPGDMIRTPTGQTVKVLRMRNHETSPGHAYMDTDQGTSVVRRKAPVQIVPANTRQQELPGYGTPGGNTNQLPMDRGNVGPGGGGGGSSSNVATSADCPVCGGKDTLHRQGQMYVCSKCGYKENFGAAGTQGQGFTFTDMPQQLRGGGPNRGPGIPLSSSLKSAIARRAQEVLDSTEENQ
jgi:hypothetical protein